MNGGHSIWAITAEERDNHDKQFDTLSPTLGYVSGDQARNFFLQSGLPSSVLAEIWSLADVGKDGKMDRLEFSIAMKLIKMKLQGQNLPSALPIIMKAPAQSSATSSTRYGMGSMPNLSIMPTLPMMPMASPMTAMSPIPALVPMGLTSGFPPGPPAGLTMSLIPTVSTSTLANGTGGFLQPIPANGVAGQMAPQGSVPLSSSFTSSPLGFTSTTGPKTQSLLDLSSSSSTSSSTASLASNSPKTGSSDWAVPQSSRLKYRQQFNSLDKQMTNYLSGAQVRGVLASSLLTQTQLAAIWNLADVDKDGQLRAEEFILAMHLVDMAKAGQPLPLTLPADLVPPSLRTGKLGETPASRSSGVLEEVEAEPPQKAKMNVSFEDKLKENFQRGHAELEKRRQALQEQERREEERRVQKAREEQEQREQEVRELERKRQQEQERRMERQRELERQMEEERLKELERKEAARQELERQRKLEWERRRRQELLNQRNEEQEDIIRLKAKKRSLELELEAVGDKHKQITDRLRDIQSKKSIQKGELDLINRKRDSCITEVNTLQHQFEEAQKKHSQLVLEQQKLKERLCNMGLNSIPGSSLSTLKKSFAEKDIACRKLKEQLEALEKETSVKLSEVDQYNNEVKELRESQTKQQLALDKLRQVKADKLREIQRRQELELERKRREEEEAVRQAKLEKERQWRERVEREEEERRRRLREEKEAKLREEEERELQAKRHEAQEQAERERRAAEEEERRKREEKERLEEEQWREERRRKEEERKRQEEERKKVEAERRKLELERKRLEEEKRKFEEERKRQEEELRRKKEEEQEMERKREREEEERRRQRAQAAALRDAEERRRKEEERQREEERRRKQQQEEEERRRKQEEEERRRKQQEEAEEEERRRKQQQEEEWRRKQEERRRKQEEEERRRKQQEEEEAAARQQKQNLNKTDIHEKLSALIRGLEDRKGGLRPVAAAHRKSAALITYRALYPFTARNADELTFDADSLIEVDEKTESEQGWLYGCYQGKMGWFPESYVEKHSKQESAGSIKQALMPPSTSVSASKPEADASSFPAGQGTPGGVGQNSAFTPTQTPGSAPMEYGQVTSGLQVQALCSWTAKTDNHLNFSKDDVITVLEQQENWWLGELNGVQGWFPKSYVTPITRNEPIYSSVDSLDTPDSTQTEEYVALYTYESPEPGDLTFTEGDTIVVTEREGDWWKGYIGDRAGVFPSNYVKPKEPDNMSVSGKLGGSSKKPEVAQVTTAYTATGSEQLSLAPGQLILIQAKNPSGWWQGVLQVRGKKRQKGWFPASHVKLLGPTSGKSTPAPVPLCQVITMYDYKAANEDEISFSKSQLINVLNKDDADWWKGELNGVVGLFPTNYVKMTTESDPSQQWCADLTSLDTMSPQERKRQGYIHELIQTEERYMADLQLVLEVFYKPMAESGHLAEAEMSMIFVNWKDLIMSNTKLLKALRVRKKVGGEKMPVQMIGDILASELSHLQAYIRFCSCQLNGAALVQQKTDQEPDFKGFLKKLATDHRCKGMPLSSFLLKPMQRITRYPLIIKNILESTPENHPDHGHLREALDRAEELCLQVNEGVREKENSDRLEWIQSHVQCEGITENLIFNSLTNCLGPRKLLHSGKVYKTKSNKELYAFLFNDFLLFTQAVKQFSSSGVEKLFSPKSNMQFKMYKNPVFLNEVLVKTPSDLSSDEPIFHISHIDRVYILRTENINERTAWAQKIKAASEHFIETEKKKREKAYQARSLKASGIGRLLVTILEATELKSCKPNGKSNPYCEVTMGAQCYTSRTINETINPKWGFNCQFSIKDLYQDVLCITIFERDQFSPDDFLGRTEVPVATIKKELENKGAATRRLLLHEVPTGEVWVRLDLQLFDQKSH